MRRPFALSPIPLDGSRAEAKGGGYLMMVQEVHSVSNVMRVETSRPPAVSDEDRLAYHPDAERVARRKRSKRMAAVLAWGSYRSIP
jgi:hypothetical protein